MAWVQTDSLSFIARHEIADTASAERTLDMLEDVRLRLEDRFREVPGGVDVIIHPTPAWLSLAHPYLPLARWAAASAGRRYLAGFATGNEVHVLSDEHLERRAAGEDSLQALQRTAARLYAELVVAANNEDLPPPWRPLPFARYLRWAWLVEGAAQYFSGQTPLFRAAVATRMREGGRPAFPPSIRDAVILGGTVFDLLESAKGPAACERLASRLRKQGPRANIETAFEASFEEVERAWRDRLDEKVGATREERRARRDRRSGRAG